MVLIWQLCSLNLTCKVRPPVNGLEDPWPMSRRCLEPRRFVGDPTSLARDNYTNPVVPKSSSF